MKVLAVALLAAATLLAAVPTAQAQVEPVPLLEDKTGDATASVQGTPASSASAVYPAVDLVSLSLAEEPASFIWTLEADDLRPGNEDTGADGATYEVYFGHNLRQFRLRISLSLPALSSMPFAYLDARDSPDGQWSGVWTSFEDTQVDFALDTITVTIPREAVADLDGAVPFPGRNLDAIHATALSTLSGGSVNIVESFGFPYSVSDAMPDDAAQSVSYPVQVGVQQSGEARLASLQPFRASNGEATTFVYQVQASNIGEDNGTYQLTVTGDTGRAQVVLPVDLLTIAAGETVEVPVLATVPFAHDHGGIDRFLLELHDLDDAGSVGRLEMGIRYLAVPQPAGHHDTLWLHLPQTGQSPAQGPAQFLSFTEGFLNTLETDDRAGEGPWHATGLSGGGTTWQSSWSLRLSPGLEMGLDLDTWRDGQAAIPIETPLPMTAATLDGILYISDDQGFGYGLEVASFSSDQVDLGAGETHTFQVAVQTSDDADLIPFQPGQNLALELRLTYTLTPPVAIGAASESPALAKGGYMILPLNEYHDDVDEALALIDGPHLDLRGPHQRLANPGEAVVFNVTLHNPTNDSVPMRVGLTGLNAGWAALGDPSFTLPAEGTANITVVVRVPADALDGERADLILQAYPRDDPMVRGLLRLVVDVDTEADHPDDAPLAKDIGGKKKDTPAPSLALLALALAGLALLRRR